MFLQLNYANLRLFSSVALLFTLAACGGGGGGSSSTPFTLTAPPVTTQTGLLVPAAGHAYFGAYVNPTGAFSEGTLNNIQASIGRKLAIDHHYLGWNQLAASGYSWSIEDADVAAGSIPLVNLNCGPYNSDIIAGTYDSQIIAIADNVKAFGHPMFFNYWWEMNDIETSDNRTGCYDPVHDGTAAGVPPGFFSPANYIAAWRHIFNIFNAQGATNAVWVFNFDGGGGQKPAQYYPGDAYVNWLGYDAYARTIGETFTETNDPAYARAIGINPTKPVMVCETGVQATDNQLAWLSGVNTIMPTRYPNIRAWLYWDSDAQYDYILSGRGLAEFSAIGSSSFFNASAAAP
jgi:hypothetical protein